jgi:hypothetical protein
MFLYCIGIVSILLPLQFAFADVSRDTDVASTLSTVQNALPTFSLAVLGGWAVLQYTEAWSVDDGPLSGVVAWWRWKLWVPPPAKQPKLFPKESSGHMYPPRNSKKYTKMPAISYQSLIICWIVPILSATAKTRGMFWTSHGSYASALFTLFIVAWRSLSKLVISVPIPIGNEDGFDAVLAQVPQSDKSGALNSLAGLGTNSIFGVFAQHELRCITVQDTLNFLENLRLCASCREWVSKKQDKGRKMTWKDIEEWLQRHKNDVAGSEECRAKPPFRWTRHESNREQPLIIDDPNIQTIIVHGTRDMADKTCFNHSKYLVMRYSFVSLLLISNRLSVARIRRTNICNRIHRKQWNHLLQPIEQSCSEWVLRG